MRMSHSYRLNMLLIHPDQQRHDCLGFTSGGRVLAVLRSVGGAVGARRPQRQLAEGRKLPIVAEDAG